MSRLVSWLMATTLVVGTGLPVAAVPGSAPAAGVLSSQASAAFRVIIDRCHALAHNDQHPMVVFDLDDTLVRTAFRTTRILHEWALTIADKPYASAFAAITPDQCTYNLEPVLQRFQVPKDEWAGANAFWAERFFTSEYLAEDKPNPGAVDFAKAVQAAGAQVVYLTGRPARMQSGTEQSLQSNGFPWDPGKTTLLMVKQNSSQNDVAFKIDAVKELAKQGTIVACIDNEPGNVNGMHAHAPGAVAVYLDKPHSPTAPPVDAGVVTAADFPDAASL